MLISVYKNWFLNDFSVGENIVLCHSYTKRGQILKWKKKKKHLHNMLWKINGITNDDRMHAYLTCALDYSVDRCSFALPMKTTRPHQRQHFHTAWWNRFPIAQRISAARDNFSSNFTSKRNWFESITIYIDHENCCKGYLCYQRIPLCLRTKIQTLWKLTIAWQMSEILN